MTTVSSPDDGQVALFLALFAVALLAMAGLVVDGGAALASRGRAHDLAEQAARAAADAITPASLRGTDAGELAIDPVAAATEARRYLAAAGATGTVQVSGNQVTVTAHVVRRSVILSAFGVDDMSGTGTSTATNVHGTTEGSP